MRGQTIKGAATIALAVGFNVPYAVLASIYAYPAILRRPAGEALDAFVAGGPALLAAWVGFMLCALALTPLASALAVSRPRLEASPGLAIGAAMTGALAGLAQAIGLSRWVFVVPTLAANHGDPAQRIAAEQAFALLNAWGGVAIGGHLGQILTAAFVLQVAVMQRAESARAASLIGMVTAALMFVGTGEGIAMAFGQPGDGFALCTIAGFAGLTLWLLVTGVALLRAPRIATLG